MYVFLKSLTYCIVNTSAVLGQIFVMFTPAFGFYDQPLVFLKSLYSNMFFYWDSLHARLKSYYESPKKETQKG